MKTIIKFIAIIFFGLLSATESFAQRKSKLKTLADFERELLTEVYKNTEERQKTHPFDKTVKIALVTSGYNSTRSKGIEKKSSTDEPTKYKPYVSPRQLFEKGFHLADQVVYITNPDSLSILSDILINTCPCETAFIDAEFYYKQYLQSLKRKKSDITTEGRWGSRDIIGCYNPRNMIVFYDNQDNVVEYMEICFQCGSQYILKTKETLSSPDCSLQVTLLIKFLREHNIITNFQEAKELFGEDFIKRRY